MVHKIEEIIATRGEVVIGCACGWVATVSKGNPRDHTGRWYPDPRSAARALYRHHKQGATHGP